MFLIEPCDDVPRGAIGYPRIDGHPLSPELFRDVDQDALASAIAGYLVDLHRIERAALPPDVPVSGPDERRAADLDLHATTVGVLRTHLSPEDYSRFDAFWRSYLNDPRMMDFPLVMTHGDLWFGNLLVDDEGHLAAVLDWEIARMGDPVRDFAGLKYLGRPFMDAVLRRYAQEGGALDRALPERLEKIMVMRELYGIRWALEDRNEDELPEAIEKLRRAVRHV
jgi:aminoglycoside phosphotransferase (APT) family kinase protein